MQGSVNKKLSILIAFFFANQLFLLTKCDPQDQDTTQARNISTKSSEIIPVKDPSPSNLNAAAPAVVAKGVQSRSLFMTGIEASQKVAQDFVQSPAVKMFPFAGFTGGQQGGQTEDQEDAEDEPTTEKIVVKTTKKILVRIVPKGSAGELKGRKFKGSTNQNSHMANFPNKDRVRKLGRLADEGPNQSLPAFWAGQKGFSKADEAPNQNLASFWAGQKGFSKPEINPVPVPVAMPFNWMSR